LTVGKVRRELVSQRGSRDVSVKHALVDRLNEHGENFA
jgi:hypothetical protein